MKIAYLFNLKRTDPRVRSSDDEDVEYEDPVVVETVGRILTKLGHTVLNIEADIDAFEHLKKHRSEIDIVFNMAEGIPGDARESQIPLICEMLGLPYTHSRPTTHAVALDKHLAKNVVSAAGVHSPAGVVVRHPEDLRLEHLTFPLIVKLNNEGSSKALGDGNIVRNASELGRTVKEVTNGFTRDVLVEDFIEGREFTVGVLGNQEPRVLPILEQKFDLVPAGMNAIASYDFKMDWSRAKSFDCPARLTEDEQALIEETSITIFRALGCRDCARIDYRLRRNRLYFIEINALPGLHPSPNVLTYFPLMAYADGKSYEDLIESLLMTAAARYPHLKALCTDARSV